MVFFSQVLELLHNFMKILEVSSGSGTASAILVLDFRQNQGFEVNCDPLPHQIKHHHGSPGSALVGSIHFRTQMFSSNMKRTGSTLRKKSCKPWSLHHRSLDWENRIPKPPARYPSRFAGVTVSSSTLEAAKHAPLSHLRALGSQ